jgi:Fe-Mn family superoxide dismutase
MSFELPKLSYAYDALEPHIDARTMEIHHSKHHAGYTAKLNAAIEGTSYVGQSIETILGGELSPGLRNNGGGYYNHCLFWSIISPKGGGKPSGKLADTINSTFGSFEEFKSVFSNAAASQFGSGWAWLCAKNGKLCVCSTPNQDNPLMKSGCGNIPILGIDVWEHAYYLNYQNRRPDYIEAFFNIVDWNEVSRRYSEA